VGRNRQEQDECANQANACTALTLGGAHGISKTSRLEQLFRDSALGPLHPSPADFCLYNMGLHELRIDPADVLPPLKPA
jgi:hypothetical protein